MIADTNADHAAPIADLPDHGGHGDARSASWLNLIEESSSSGTITIASFVIILVIIFAIASLMNMIEGRGT